MKALQCSTCGMDAELPDGKPYLVGRAPTFHRRSAFLYMCARCGHPSEVTAEQYARLPEVPLPRLKELGVHV
jgi:DNA-directed RNA polymerase subunit RPC12/RpoP